MEIDDIKDKDSLAAWLKTRPREDAVAIAHRVALRVFPLFGRAMREGWVRTKRVTSLPSLRSFQSTRAWLEAPSENLANAAEAAASFAFSSGHSYAAVQASHASTDASTAAYMAGGTVNAALDAAIYSAAAVADVAILRRPAPIRDDAWNAMLIDARILDEGSPPSGMPLWPDTPPDWFTRADRETRAIWAENPAHWDFWTRWWDAAIAGTPLNWDLQRDIALIPDEVWQQGPGPVAIEIARLEELHDLRRELAELKRRFTDPPPAVSVAAGAELRGHNNPPELLETNAEMRENLILVWQALDDAETELAKRHPEPAALKRIATWLLTATNVIALYCAKLGDTAVKNAAAEFGKAGGKWLAGGAAFGIALNIPPIARFAERLIDFIK